MAYDSTVKAIQSEVEAGAWSSKAFSPRNSVGCLLGNRSRISLSDSNRPMKFPCWAGDFGFFLPLGLYKLEGVRSGSAFETSLGLKDNIKTYVN